MGREIRRVPLDFDWPLGQRWPGFIRPDVKDCPECDGGGWSAMGEWLEHFAQLLLLLDADAPHPWLLRLPLAPQRLPEPDIAGRFGSVLSGRAAPWGHDALDRWAAQKRLAEAGGLTADDLRCSNCGGDGLTSEGRAIVEAWERTPPPEGPGWQVWETVSEGSPITPVFETPEALIDHLVNEPVFGRRWDLEAAERIVRDGSTFSAVKQGGRVYASEDARP